MTRYEKLQSEIADSDIVCEYTTSYRLSAFAVRVDGDYGIFFNEGAYRTTAERYVALGHEKAHCDTGALYSEHTPLITRERCEYRANKKSVYALVPLDELIDAIETPWNSVYDLAERFSVTDKFMRKALNIYEHDIRNALQAK